MGLVAWVVSGMVLGIMAKLIMPQKDPGAMILTVILGITGALIGGFTSTKAGFGHAGEFDLLSLLMAVGGAILLLIVYRVARR
jgi:uncharacterized membrane protein YeaQ/YmgE (transglycosylase-associated protein family)